MGKKSTKLKLSVLNARSLNTGRDELIYTIKSFDPDIITITETWLSENAMLKNYNIPGYNFFHAPRSGAQSRGGGVGAYIRSNLKVKILSAAVSELEQQWFEIKVNRCKIAVGVVYRPPKFSFSTFLSSLDDNLSLLIPKYTYVFVTGDINIDLNSHGVSQKDFLTLIAEYQFHQIVNKPTRVTDTSSSLLDVICCNDRLNASEINIEYNDDLSDHAFITATFPLEVNKPIPRVVQYRPFNDFDLETYQFASSITPWDMILQFDQLDTMVECFNFLILGLFDHFVPLKTKRFKYPPSPWVTDSIKAMMIDRNEACNTAKKTNSDHDKNLYKQLKNTVYKATQKEKSFYFTNKINKSIKNPKKMYGELKKFLGTNSNTIPAHLCDPNLINKTFLDSVPSVSYNCNIINKYEKPIYFGCDFLELSTDNVLKIINSIVSNAVGIDDISIKMIKLTLPYSLVAITYIINTSLRTGCFPRAWKTAIIKPLPKKTNIESVKDLRPIGILPALSKVLEKVVNQQITSYFENHFIIPKCQSGFRKSHSTTTALLHIVDEIFSASNNNMATILILLDYSRAFDCLNIDLLIAKLKFYGCSDLICKWFSSYFEDRLQIVEVSGINGRPTRSSALKVKRGVIQGSILGPILYSIYTADLHECVKSSLVHMYADDTQLLLNVNPYANTDISTSIENINDDLSRIHSWSRNHDLSLNTQKCTYIIFGTRQQMALLSQMCQRIFIDGHPLAESKLVKNLGVKFDGSLRFQDHISSVISKCYASLKMIYKFRPFLSESARSKLVESLVLSHLDYCDVLYGPCLYKKTERKIQRVQNSCLRFCYNIHRYSHITPYLNSNNILNMKNRRILKLNTITFNLKYHKIPSYLANKLKWSESSESNCRSNRVPRLVLSRPHLQTFRGSFRFAASKCWNDIPPPIKINTSLNKFKTQCKQWLLAMQKSQCVWTNICEN